MNPVNRKQRRRARSLWPLARVMAKCSKAPVIYQALLELAGLRESIVVPTTRLELASVSGVKRAPTISEALTVLELAGWIDRVHVNKFEGGSFKAKLLKVILNKEHVLFSILRGPIRNTRRNYSKLQQPFLDSLQEGVAPPAVSGSGPPQSINSSNSSSSALANVILSEAKEPLTVDGVPMAVAAVQEELRRKRA